MQPPARIPVDGAPVNHIIVVGNVHAVLEIGPPVVMHGQVDEFVESRRPTDENALGGRILEFRILNPDVVGGRRWIVCVCNLDDLTNHMGPIENQPVNHDVLVVVLEMEYLLTGRGLQCHGFARIRRHGHGLAPRRAGRDDVE